MKQGLLTTGEQLFARATAALQRHPKRLTALVAAVLLCGGGGAYAVASLGPDASLLPVREVLEAVQPLPLDEQSEALAAHSFSVFTSEVVRPTDTLETLLARLGVQDAEAAAYLRRDAGARQQMGPGRTVHAETTDGRNLLRLTVRWAAQDPSRFHRLVVQREGGEFRSRIETAALQPSLRISSGLIRTSLFAAADDAGIPDAVTLQMVEIFAGSIDFHRSLRVGDQFAVIYETLEADGEPLRTGRVVSAEFVNAGRKLDALWFEQPGQSGSYFNFQGESLERHYLASPMQITRITSGFKMRLHPIHKVWRAHNGVDYGAPTGAPVRTVGEGRVKFAGRMGGYGNVVEIDHGNGDTTLYAHLSRIHVRQGQPVQRGQEIGAVGATGWATGPHLHFEFRQRGQHRDPLEVARQSQGKVLSAQARPAFQQLAQSFRTQLTAATVAPMLASAR